MKDRMSQWLVVTLVLSLSLIGCEFDGTDTGNPMSGITSGYSHTRSYKAIKRSCDKLVDCNGSVILADCLEGSFPLKTFASKLGLPVEYSLVALSGIISDEVDKLIVPDVDNAVTCEADIAALACGDPTVVGAYDDSLENPYAAIADILPVSCVGIFDY